MASQEPDTRWRFRALLAYIAFCYFVAFVTPILTDTTRIVSNITENKWEALDRYWLYGCNVLIAGWIALGPGRLILRMTQGLIAAGWLILAWMLGLSMSPNWRKDHEWTMFVAAVVGIAMFTILIVVRRWSGRTFVRDQTSDTSPRRFQYSLTTLFLVTLFICLTFAISRWIDPRYRDYTWFWLGWRKTLFERIGGEAVGSLVVAGACWSLFLGQRERALAWALCLSIGAFVAACLIDAQINVEISIPLLQSLPSFWIRYEISGLATILLCLVIAATVMHWLGYRLSAKSVQSWTPG
jgi:hypothetical protein